MATQKPLVLINGRPSVIPAGDTLDAAALPPSGGGGGGATIETAEIDLGPTPVKNKTVTVVDAGVSPTTKIIVTQAGRAATGRAADENEWTRLSLVPFPEAGQFKLWVSCLTGRMRGKFNIDYIKG